MQSIEEFGKEINSLANEMNEELPDRFFDGSQVLGAFSFYQQMKAVEEMKERAEANKDKSTEVSTSSSELPF